MDLLAEIRKSDKKSKELTSFISKIILDKKPAASDFCQAVRKGNDSERGTCVEALEFASQTKPEIAKLYLAEIITCLSDKAPRVKWEASRIIGNVAKIFPQETGKAVENLRKNTQDKGTVVRWSTAYALGEIAKSNSKIRPLLLKEINALIKKETNGGVKNVYLKALKEI